MYWCQLNCSAFCATSALGVSWQHLNHPNLLVLSVHRFHVDFHVGIIVHHLGVPLPYEDNSSKVKYSYIIIVYYSICDDYGVSTNEIWMYGNWFFTAVYGLFGCSRTDTQNSPPENLTRWIIT